MFGRVVPGPHEVAEQTPEEAELETRYSGNGEEEASIDALRRQLDDVPYDAVKKAGGSR